MPYKRRYRKSTRRPRRQSTWKRMVGIGKQLYAGRGALGYAIRGVNMLKNLVNAEAKFLDTSINVSVSSSGTVQPLSLIGQGTTDITRVGNSILCKDITAKYIVSQNASATNTSVRWVLFLDKQNANGTAPTMTDLLQSAGVTQPMNRDNADRFVILRTGIIDLSINGTRQRHIQIYKDLSRLHIKYDGTDATQASAAEHQLYLGLISNEATNTPTFGGVSRIHFYDN